MTRTGIGFSLALLLGITLLAGSIAGLATVVPTDQGNPSPDQGHRPPSAGGSPPTGINVDHNRSARSVEMRTTRAQFGVIATGEVPFYRWYDVDNLTMNMIKIMRLVEYKDLNDDEMFQSNEKVQHLQLQGGANWTFSELLSNDTMIVFSFTTSDISVAGFSQTVLNFTNYLNNNSDHLKFDIKITNWPWNSTSDRLAFEFTFNTVSHDARNRNIRTINASSDAPQNLPQERGFYMRNDNGGVAGYFTASEEALDQDGTVIPVVTQIESQGNGTSARIFLNYPHFGTSLLHDPTIGSGDDGGLASTISEAFSWLISKPSLLVATTVLGLIVLTSLYARRKRLH